MPIVEWENKFLLGVEQFDEHHKHLVTLLNTAYDYFTSETPPENTANLLDELVDYATYHFAAEEYWMKESEYSKLAEHTAEHNRFSSRVSEMLHDFYDGRENLSLEVLVFLKNWLTNHILVADADYGKFVAAINKKM